MARKNSSIARLQVELRSLNASVPEDLFLPSLRQPTPRLRGHAFRFQVVLPMYGAHGEPVFTPDHLVLLFTLFNQRVGGSLAPNSRSGAPYFGEYQPEGPQPVRDYHTLITAYANPVEASDRFFEKLKEILRTAPLIPQDEILIERTEVFLV